MLKPAIAGVTNVLGMFTGATKSAQGAIEVLKTALVIITGVFVGLKVVQLANSCDQSAAIWDGAHSCHVRTDRRHDGLSATLWLSGSPVAGR